MPGDYPSSGLEGRTLLYQFGRHPSEINRPSR